MKSCNPGMHIEPKDEPQLSARCRHCLELTTFCGAGYTITALSPFIVRLCPTCRNNAVMDVTAIIGRKGE